MTHAGDRGRMSLGTSVMDARTESSQANMAYRGEPFAP